MSDRTDNEVLNTGLSTPVEARRLGFDPAKYALVALVDALDEIKTMTPEEKADFRVRLTEDRDALEQIYGPMGLSLIGSLIGYLPLKEPRT